MWTLFAWTISSLLLHAAASIQETQPATAFSEGIISAVVTPIRIDSRNHPFPKQQQFRRRGQNPWLGTIRYKWRAFNRTWRLDLQPNLPRSVHLRKHRHWPHHLQVFNATSVEVRDQIRDGCYYTGTIRGDPTSFVGVSLCGGLTGDIHSTFGGYVIHPSSTIEDGFLVHRLSSLETVDASRLWRPLNATQVNFCAFTDSPSTGINGSSHLPSIPRRTYLQQPLVRKKRSESRELHLEVLVVADTKMAQYHGPNLRHYVLTLMATVALIYKDPSIGNNINIAVVDITVLDESVDYDVIHAVAPTTLRKFCNWQHKHNHPDDRDPSHHDAAILITREDLCRFPGACDTLGLAQSGMMCDPYSSCAIVEDNGLSAAFTIAHELGHVMSIPHDDDRKCSKYLDERKKLHVMARMLDYNSHPWSWSQCSRHYVTTFFDVGYGHCLRDRPARNLLMQDEEFQQPPGQLYSRDRQCQLIFGHKSRICPYMPECKRLWCTMDDGTQGGCRTQHMPWADGTQCDNGKRCYRGECVRLTPTRLTPVDGQWGEWKQFGKCSRSCGGGIQQALRECDLPKPANGGRYCTGVRVKYKSCNVQDCPAGSQDFREEQCAEFNGRRLNFPGLSSAVSWVPHYIGIAANDYCKLYCQVVGSPAYFVLREKVVDGTPCSLGSHNICVNGNCEHAGCDHVLNSNKTLDRCGVCGGKNTTCKEITGRFEKAVDYGYHDVVMIPPGASNIQIRQYSSGNETDDNYIVLKDPDKNYILNGDYMISMFPKTLQYHGVTIDYSGSDSIVEHLNSTKPLKKDLYVQVLIVGKIQPPHITFSYTVPISGQFLYTWKMAEDFSECSRLCNGLSYRRPICVRQMDLRQVSNGHCPQSTKSIPIQQRPCNLDCKLKWQDVSKSECSVSCGQGVRQRIIKCMKQGLQTNISQAVPEELCFHIKPKPLNKEICQGNCLNSSWTFSDWSECSVSCGAGMQKRSAECRNAEQTIQPDSHCNFNEKIISRTCNHGSCPKWGVGEWTECSVSCGRGKRMRPYWCHIDNKIIAPWYCNSNMVPQHTEVCKQPPCMQWKSGNWTPCSTSCGIGTRRRDVYCMLPDEAKIEDQRCEALNRPSDVENCNNGPCAKSHFERFSIFKKRPIPSMTLTRGKSASLPEPNDGTAYTVRETGVWKEGPWSKCSLNCGKRIKSRKVTCHHSHTDSRIPLLHCDPLSKPSQNMPCVNIKNCMDWITEAWSKCFCPTGLRRRHIVCPGDEHLSECDPEQKPKSEEFCDCDVHMRHQNHKWESGPWTECSATCGIGRRQRLVACINSEGSLVHESKCFEETPSREEACILQPCQLWKWSHWSQCSTTCGNGIQVRSAHCLNQAENICGKPDPEKRSCSVKKTCQSFRWRKGMWSRCSESCGPGYKTREVFCLDSKNRRTDLSHCSNLDKPRDRKHCSVKPCDFTWVAGNWSECSRTCDDGFLNRSVSCHRVNSFGWIDPTPVTETNHFDERCDLSKKPKHVKSCNYGNCSSGYIWKPEKWSECLGRCGKERQKRKLTCYDKKEKKMPHKYCNRKLKPQRKRHCKKTQSCKPQSCADLQKMENQSHDGNYTIYIKGMAVDIYCHLMNSTSPQDFISLDEHNYAHIFSPGTRWSTYEDCLQKTGQSDCDCHRQDAGLTKFRKIAVNISTLQVITNDFTFSDTYYGQPVSYGSAGDCIYTPRCPQGKFSISLKTTGFRISEKTTWIHHRQRTQKTIHRNAGGQVVRGICGGYCGSCFPQDNPGLLLDITPS